MEKKNHLETPTIVPSSAIWDKERALTSKPVQTHWFHQSPHWRLAMWWCLQDSIIHLPPKLCVLVVLFDL